MLSGQVEFEDVWLFGHHEPKASRTFILINISPVPSTTAPSQKATRQPSPVRMVTDLRCDSWVLVTSPVVSCTVWL